MSNTTAAPNTHNVIVDFGKHKGTLLTRVPVGYLRWMTNEKGLAENWRSLAKAELDRRGHHLPTIELSGHAIDTASLRVRKIWHETALNNDEGLYSWLIRISNKAIASGVRDGGAYFYLGLKLVIEHGEEWPVLKTVMQAKNRHKAEERR